MENLIVAREKVQLRNIKHEHLKELWTLIYGEENPEFKKWDAPYFPLERIEYPEFESRMKKELNKV